MCSRTACGPAFGVIAPAKLRAAETFGKPRQLAIGLDLGATEHPYGELPQLGTISCRSDAYLRTLLIQGARSSLQRAKAVATETATPEKLWIRTLDGRMPFGKAIVAIANRHARQIWAMLARGVDDHSHACLKHPMHQQGRAT